MPSRLEELIALGVKIPSPQSVEVDSAVDPGKIAPGVVIHAGCKILGSSTSIGPGCEIGLEAPVTIENCQLAEKVSLKGGYFAGATFLDHSNMGSGAHIRPGTLLEEEAGGAHTVGFKQTIFFPFVTAGSLINFCDCLMAGGTSRKNHSEIGSSYIHFNFTPHQDKATPSLVGDVPRGVMLDQQPIFLGGQGGLVGPARIAYGTIIPAGVLCRKDILTENQLYSPPAPTFRESSDFLMGAYKSINRIVINNLIYIGNLWALKAWYQNARKRFLCRDRFGEACYAGALGQLSANLEERIKRLKELAGKMQRSLQLACEQEGPDLPDIPYAQQRALMQRWPEMEAHLLNGPHPDTGSRERDSFLESWERIGTDNGYLKAVGELSAASRASGTAWLQAIVESAVALWKKM
jgi:bifunctional UDP-N-acetylglucosamine pyrophosphorylase / glucosamine-1-phosphate N-acetyltransferase